MRSVPQKIRNLMILLSRSILPLLTLLTALTLSLWPDLALAFPKTSDTMFPADSLTLNNSSNTSTAAVRSNDFIHSANFSVVTLSNSVSFTSALSKPISFTHGRPLSGQESSEEQEFNQQVLVDRHHGHGSSNHILQKRPQTLNLATSRRKNLPPQLHKSLKLPLSKKSNQTPTLDSSPTITSACPPTYKGLSSPRLENTTPKPFFPLPTTHPTHADTSSTRSHWTGRQTPYRPHTSQPLFDHQPFMVTWNIPDLVCNRHNISLDTSPFTGVTTPAKVPGQFLSLFYTDRLGFYPHVDPASQKQVYGGIPQRVNMKASMNKARADINFYIPSKISKGLAVIDWEEWRPLWDRNWGRKRVYQSLSISHALKMNHSLTGQQVTEKAKQQFQQAARSVMSEMLSVGRTMRPNYHWGFYLFPNCYNHGWQEPGYTGECSEEVRRQNDELLWLWESSSALYPSVYLQAALADNPKAALMVRNRVQEALRVSALPGLRATLPVFVYVRPVFVDQNRRFLSLRDLMSTIGESAAVGASGAVLWGASGDYTDKTSCETLSSYLDFILNPYIINVTAAAQLCSNYLCRGKGRCVRKNYKSHHYLHLDPHSFRVLRVQKRYLVLGRPTLADLKALSRSFTCQCYKGVSCAPRTYRELTKALMFKAKQESNRKSYTLTKAGSDETKQASIRKESAKGNLINRLTEITF